MPALVWSIGSSNCGCGQIQWSHTHHNRLQWSHIHGPNAQSAQGVTVMNTSGVGRGKMEVGVGERTLL